MSYTISGDTVGLALGPMSDTADDVNEALEKARQMYETGLVNVSIKDDAGHKIDGDDYACNDRLVVVAMSKCLTFSCIFTLVLGTIADGNAASTLKMTCSGSLTNTSANGVTLGQCDLNFITVKQMDEIQTICGIPGTVDTPAENQCRIRAVVSPDPIPTADHRKLYKVIEVWSVDKR